MTLVRDQIGSGLLECAGEVICVNGRTRLPPAAQVMSQASSSRDRVGGWGGRIISSSHAGLRLYSCPGRARNRVTRGKAGEVANPK